MSDAERELLARAAAYIRQDIRNFGGCEHDVGHCVCAAMRLAEELEAASGIPIDNGDET